MCLVTVNWIRFKHIKNREYILCFKTHFYVHVDVLWNIHNIFFMNIYYLTFAGSGGQSVPTVILAAAVSAIFIIVVLVAVVIFLVFWRRYVTLFTTFKPLAWQQFDPTTKWNVQAPLFLFFLQQLRFYPMQWNHVTVCEWREDSLFP